MTSNGYARQIQLGCEWVIGVLIQALQLAQHEFQVLQAYGRYKSERRFIATPRVSEVAAKLRFDQPPVRKFNCGRFEGVVDRGHHVPTACQVFENERVVRKGRSVTRREDDNWVDA